MRSLWCAFDSDCASQNVVPRSSCPVLELADVVCEGFGGELFHLEEVSFLAGAVDQENRGGVGGVGVAVAAVRFAVERQARPRFLGALWFALDKSTGLCVWLSGQVIHKGVAGTIDQVWVGLLDQVQALCRGCWGE